MGNSDTHTQEQTNWWQVASLLAQTSSEPGSKDARLLRTYGSSCIDLAQMMEQFQVPSSGGPHRKQLENIY
jgi:hypothetical protein